MNINESLDGGEYERLVERVSRRIDDPQLLSSLKEILATSQASQELLAPLLAGIAFEEIEHILQQAKALIFLSPLLHDIYANRPHEVAASATLPPGFYLGEHHGDSWWQGEATPGVHYGLYVPPHFRKQRGPFPSIVFLHGYGERTKTLIFKAGLAPAIAQSFGTKKPNGPFPFVAFFPLDPTGGWQADSAEVENAMRALDYVIERHRIDRARIYLTGHSAGGSGVWCLAEAYPNKWAAVVPVCAFINMAIVPDDRKPLPADRRS